jgi:hypothetical protein
VAPRLPAQATFAMGVAVAILAVGACVPVAAAPGDLVVGTAGPTCVNPQFATIQAAVTAATAGATIRVCAGTYPETVVVDKPLTFLGAQAGVDARTGRTVVGDESVVDSPTGDFSVQPGVGNVTIDGFTIRDAGTPVQDADGISAFQGGGSGFSFLDNIIANNTYGINFQSTGASPTLVEHNRFVNDNQTGAAGGTGVFVSNGPANESTITQNSFSGHSSAAVNTTGTTTNFSRDLLITDNTSVDDGNFAVVVNTTGGGVEGNTITHTDPNDPTAGSAVFIGGNTDGLVVDSNTIVGGAASGVRVTSLFGAPSTGLSITRNSITSRLNGVRVSGGQTSGLIDGNSVTGSSNDGILIDAGNSGLRVTRNTAHASTVYDCQDNSTGTGTAGTANQWTGDIGDTSLPVGLCADPPVLTIAKTHSGDFRQGQRGATYTLTVADTTGAGPTNGTTVALTDTLPAGLTATAVSGPGWTCTLAPPTCSRQDVLAPGAAYPPVTLTVRVGRHAPRRVINTATVSGGGDTAARTALDPTTVKRDRHHPDHHRPQRPRRRPHHHPARHPHRHPVRRPHRHPHGHRLHRPRQRSAGA